MTVEARQLFSAGVDEYKAAHWAQARAKFTAARALSNHYSIVGNLASSEARLGMFRDAAEHCAIYARELNEDAKSTPAQRKAAAELCAEARAKVATVVVSVNVRGAAVYVDGKLVGTTPLADPVFFAPGPDGHTIEARKDAYWTVQKSIAAPKAGTAQTVKLTLVPFAVAPAVLTAVALGAGIGLTVAANAQGSNADALRTKVGSNSACSGAAASSTDCSALLHSLKNRDSFTKGAFASFLLGGAFAAATTGLGLWAAGSKDRKAAQVVRVVPVWARDEAGVIVLGSF